MNEKMILIMEWKGESPFGKTYLRAMKNGKQIYVQIRDRQKKEKEYFTLNRYKVKILTKLLKYVKENLMPDVRGAADCTNMTDSGVRQIISNLSRQGIIRLSTIYGRSGHRSIYITDIGKKLLKKLK